MSPKSPRVPLVAAALLTGALLAGCGDSDDGASSSTSTTPAVTATATSSASASPTDDAVQNIEITMTGSKVDPAPGTIDVKKGSRVTITVTRDSDGEIHVHGADEQSKDAKAGVPVTFTFDADQTGVFEVEAHHPDRLLTKLQVS